MTAVMGIDPGVRGGVAVLSSSGTPVFVEPFVPKMAHRELVSLLWRALAALRAEKGAIVVIEKVGYIRGDGGMGAFTFGRVDGLIRGAVLMAGYPITDVMPMVWQGAMGCPSGGNKNVTKKKAATLFPTVKMTHAIADALLIAEYGRRRTVDSTLRRMGI